MFAYRILIYKPYENKPDYCTFIPQYKRGVNGNWKSYTDGFGTHDIHHTWNAAYAVLEKHANPAALAAKFVGTF